LIGTNKTALSANTITFFQTNVQSGTSGAAVSSKTKLAGGGGKGKERASPVGLSRNIKTGIVPSSLREALPTTNVRWSGSFSMEVLQHGFPVLKKTVARNARRAEAHRALGHRRKLPHR
jgi:hypothetical protein